MMFRIQSKRVLPALSAKNAHTEPPLQPVLIQAANFAKSAVKVVRHAANTGRVFSTKEQREARTAICPECPFFRPSDKRCGHPDCNCGHVKRAAFEGVSCPDKRW